MRQTTRQINYELELEQLRNMENLQSTELVVQTVLVGSCSIAAWFFLGIWQVPLWFLVNYGLVSVEKRLLARQALTPSRRLYFSHLGLSFSIASTAAFLPIFLWYSDEAILQYAALAFMIGATLNTFLIRSKSWQVMLCYMLPNSVVLFAIAFSFFRDTDTLGEGLLALSIAAAVTIYFLTSISEATRQHREHLATQQNLLHAQKVETLGTLAGGIAHDFNNLLNVVSGNLELLRDGSRVSSKDEMISQALLATQRAATMTQKLLAFGRRSHLVSKTVKIEQLFDELEDLIMRLLPESINIHFFTETNTSPVLVDENALHSAIINLVINSKDALTDGGSITISARNYSHDDGFQGFSTMDETSGEYVQITVRDTGCGIEPGLLSSVLDPYVTSKPVGDGSGLGLAMVSGFAKQSSGGIRIQSAVGHGTTVDLLLPASNVAVATEVRASLSVESTAKTNAKILIVEDEPELLNLLATHLTSVGHVVKISSSGDEAVSILNNGYRPELVITDVVMPGEVQGLGLIKIAASMMSNTQFIVISGYAPPKDRLPSEIEDRVQFLSKPVLLSELSNYVRDRLSNSATLARVEEDRK